MFVTAIAYVRAYLSVAFLGFHTRVLGANSCFQGYAVASQSCQRRECKLTEIRIRPLPLPVVLSLSYELGVMRFPCNEIAMSDGFEKQILAPTVPRCVHTSD